MRLESVDEEKEVIHRLEQMWSEQNITKFQKNTIQYYNRK